VTGQPSDRRCTTKARATARLLRGDFDSIGEAALRPISRRRDTTGSWEAAGETAAGSPKGETSGSE